MTKINRRLLSGASFAALAFGIPSAAQAACPEFLTGPGVTTVTAGSASCTVNGNNVTATGVAGQAAIGSSFITVNNPGLIFASAWYTGGGNGFDDALAMAVTATGVTATGKFVNSGTVSAVAFRVNATTSATAWAVGVQDVAAGTLANVTVTNTTNAIINARATASAWGGSDVFALATAIGVNEYALAGWTGHASVNNNGWIGVVANATATDANGVWGDATASANASGIFQQALGLSGASATVNNAGTITVHANAYASNANDDARAYATAYGVYQSVGAKISWAASGVVNNTGWIGANANATAWGAGDDASATAKAFRRGSIRSWSERASLRQQPRGRHDRRLRNSQRLGCVGQCQRASNRRRNYSTCQRAFGGYCHGPQCRNYLCFGQCLRLEC